jgi:hypothetical protein
MKSNTEAMQIVDRLLRTFPRHPLVLEACEELKARIVDNRVREATEGPVIVKPVLKTFDKTAYQRVYMRAYRAKKSTKKIG